MIDCGLYDYHNAGGGSIGRRGSPFLFLVAWQIATTPAVGTIASIPQHTQHNNSKQYVQAVRKESYFLQRIRHSVFFGAIYHNKGNNGKYNPNHPQGKVTAAWLDLVWQNIQRNAVRHGVERYNRNIPLHAASGKTLYKGSHDSK